MTAPGRGFRHWTLAAGLYNIVSSAPLAVPGADRIFLRFIDETNRALGAGGGTTSGPRDAVSALLANTAGLVLVLVGALLVDASRDLANRWRVPLLNALTRIVFASLIVYYCATADLPRILLGLGAMDLMFASAFLYFIATAQHRAGDVRTVPPGSGR